jgi:ADP-heptose:LPS heptosyltransferase
MGRKVFEGHHEARGDLMSEHDRLANRHLSSLLYQNHLAYTFPGQDLLHLDIGSKYPFFGYCLQQAASESGRTLISHGVDGIAEAREFGQKLDVLMAVGDIESSPTTWDMSGTMAERVAQGGFHCVTLIHCMEHFFEPLQTLRRIRGLMADGGILYIRSPDSQAPGIVCDFTPGHYEIHPTIWCERAVNEALARLEGAFEIYETYEIAHQRDYLMRAVPPKPMRDISGGDAENNHTETTGSAKVLKPAGQHGTRTAATRETRSRIINLLRPGAIGDVLASSAATAALADRHPDAEVRYYTRVPQMAKLLSGVHGVYDSGLWAARAAGADFNLIGYPLAEGYPERPMQRHLTAYFCDEVGVPIGLPRLSDALEPFDISGRWITLHPKSGWSVYKDWALENWEAIVRRIHQFHPGVAVVQIGVTDDPPVGGVDHDLRGATSIAQALWLVRNSVLHLGVDSFTNHAAGAFQHPAVIIFGSTSPTGSGYETAINLWAGLNCSPCYREDPRISRNDRGPCIDPPGQDYDQPHHACMAAITVETVWGSVESLIGGADRSPLHLAPKSPAAHAGLAVQSDSGRRTWV